MASPRCGCSTFDFFKKRALRLRFLLLPIAILLWGKLLLHAATPSVSVLTYHNDLQRTGANSQETLLTPSNVNETQFGKLASYAVDGQVYAQPLVVPNLQIAGGTHNVVYVATEHDSVYAFDADGKASGAFWHRSLIDPAAGINPASSSDTEGISPEIGITGTPVIDPNTGTMYLVTMTNESGNNMYHLYALDIISGANKVPPVRLNPSVQGTGFGNVNGVITIEPGCYQRPGLLLLNGLVYVAWGHCEHGWIASFDAGSLAQVAVYNTSPNGKGAAIWMSGGAPAVDPQGNIYIMTGVDADSTTSTGFSNAFLKFSPSLTLLDFFQPSNNVFLTQNDADLGSGAPVILPDNASNHPQEVVGGGKDGRIFLLDRNNLGGFNTTTNNVVEIVQTGTQQFDNIFDTPAFFNGNIYLHCENDVMRVFQYSNGLLSTSPVQTGSIVYGIHGATASISANGNNNALAWEIQVDQAPNGGHAVLHAFDALNVTSELFNSSVNVARDVAGPAVKFVVPSVANGHVYVGTSTELDIYGLLPQNLVVWRNSSTGEDYVWGVNGTSVSANAPLPMIGDLNWKIVGTGDFNGDGNTDVLWRNQSTGDDFMWLMYGLSVASSGPLPTISDLNWKIVGVGDLNGDGRADIVWRNSSTGEDFLWLMNGLSVASSGPLPQISDLNWQIVAVGDFDGDGKADIFWRNKQTGATYVWLMNGTTVVNNGSLPVISDPNWQVVGSGDFDGDGKADILWRNTVTGENYLWLMNGLSISSAGALPQISDTNWQIVEVADLNHDGKADILWRNASTGADYVWLMNGFSIVGQGALPTIGDTNWQVF